MRRPLFLTALLVAGGAACTVSDSTDSGAERTGATFLPVTPCLASTDYEPGANVTIQIHTDPTPAYAPTCVKIAVGEGVSIEGSPAHPFIGTMETNASDGSPISNQLTTGTVFVSFAVSGFYSFECPTESNMKGVVWVAPP